MKLLTKKIAENLQKCETLVGLYFFTSTWLKIMTDFKQYVEYELINVLFFRLEEGRGTNLQWRWQKNKQYYPDTNKKKS